MNVDQMSNCSCIEIVQDTPKTVLILMSYNLVNSMHHWNSPDLHLAIEKRRKSGVCNIMKVFA